MNKMIIILFSISSCSHQPNSRPVLLQSSSVLCDRHDTITLITNFKGWDITLFGFIKPIPFSVLYNNNTMQIIPKFSSSIPSQEIHLALSHKNICHVYDIILNNSDQKILIQSYRSPKSLSLDSSLLQYKILYAISDHRNLVIPDSSVSFFAEQENILSPLAGSYIQDTTKPTKTFYVQPGSPVSINLYIESDSLSNCNIIKTNYLQDISGNEISDATLIYFHVSNGSFARIYERYVIDGYAYISLPFTYPDSLFISAKIGLTSSSTVIFKK
jgi:hypothetical protein